MNLVNLAEATKELARSLRALATLKPIVEKAIHDTENSAECVDELKAFQLGLAHVAGAYTAVVDLIKQEPNGYTTSISWQVNVADVAVEAALVPYFTAKGINDHADGWEAVADDTRDMLQPETDESR